MSAIADPTWRAVRIGHGPRPWAVRCDEFGPFAVGRPGRFRPRGAIITFGSQDAAEARAAKLNAADNDERPDERGAWSR